MDESRPPVLELEESDDGPPVVDLLYRIFEELRTANALTVLQTHGDHDQECGYLQAAQAVLDEWTEEVHADFEVAHGQPNGRADA
jgi:hypothetical protein